MSRRTGFTGSTLERLLARLADIEVAPSSRLAFADRLGRWVGWTDAISLSAALSATQPAVAGSPADAAAAAAAAAASVDPHPDETEFARVRMALARPLGADHPPAADFRPYRRRYHSRQQAMEVSIAPLRGRLRATLAAGTPAMSRLATLDAAMEALLGARERSLLSTVPVLLERHFERSRPAASATTDGEPERPPAPDDAWLANFQQDMQAVLLAELELRLQPVEGLVQALRLS